MANPTHKITELLKAWSNGDVEALDKLLRLVDRELRKIARRYMARENRAHILQPTALVNEALIKLIRENLTYENRRHFYFMMMKRMRQVLIDYAKKTPPAEQVEIQAEMLSIEKAKDHLMLEQALQRLAELDERKAKIVECRFFMGLSVAETARLLEIGTATVERDWSFSRAWLNHQISDQSQST